MYKRKLAKQHGNLSFPWCVLAALYAGCLCEGMFLLVCVVVFTTMEAFYGCWTVIAVLWLLLLLTHGNKENKKHCLPLPFLTFSSPLLPPSLGFFNITNLYRIIPVPCTSLSSSAFVARTCEIIVLLGSLLKVMAYWRACTFTFWRTQVAEYLWFL